MENIPESVFSNWLPYSRDDGHHPLFNFVLLVGIETDFYGLMNKDLAGNRRFPEKFEQFHRADDGKLELVMTFYRQALPLVHAIMAHISSVHRLSTIRRLQEFQWVIYQCSHEDYTYPTRWPIEEPHPRDLILVITCPANPPPMNDFAKLVFSFPIDEDKRDNDPDGRYMVAFDDRYDWEFPRYGPINERRIRRFARKNRHNSDEKWKQGLNRFWADYSGKEINLFE